MLTEDETGEKIFIYAFPLTAYDISGYIYMVHDYSDIRDALLNLTDLGVNDYALIRQYDNFEIIESGSDTDPEVLDIDILKEMMASEDWSAVQMNKKHVKGGIYYAIDTQMPTNPIVFFFVSNRDIVANCSAVFDLVSVLWFVNAVLVMLAFVLIQIRMNTNLKKLTCEMEKVYGGDYDVTVDIDSGDEIEQLGKTFNRMITSIKENVNEINENHRKILEHEKKEEEMKYAIIFSQVNPHFIYNMMNNITYMARDNRNSDIIEFNKALMNFLRDRLRINDFKMYDTIEQEISVINDFVTLNRFSNNMDLTVEWFVDDRLKKVMIPKNIILPFASNSVEHGILPAYSENKITSGKIVIDVKQVFEKLMITVSDNGIGMDQELIDKYFYAPYDEGIEKGLNIGIRNVRNILEKLFNGRYMLQAGSGGKYSGLSVTIVIPFENDGSLTVTAFNLNIVIKK